MGKNVMEQRELDDLMIKLDGTENKSASEPTRSSECRWQSEGGCVNAGVPVYVPREAGRQRGGHETSSPLLQRDHGGSHAGNVLPFQEYMIAPVERRTSARRLGCYHKLKALLKKKYGQDAVNVGDEGGFDPPIGGGGGEEPLQVLVEAIKEAGYEGKIKICMDCAASEMWNESACTT